MSANHLRLVSVDGQQVAPAPKRRVRAKAIRQEREIRLCIIKEHLGHLAHSLARLKILTDEMEADLGLTLPDCTHWPRPDALSGASGR
jgi:hypothetical protein